MIVYEERLEQSKHLQRPETNVVHLGDIIACIYEVLTIAKILLAETTTNLKLDVLVEGIARSIVTYNKNSYTQYPGGFAVDNTSSAEAMLRSEQLNDGDFTTQLLVDLIYQLMWPFNWHNREEINLCVNQPKQNL